MSERDEARQALDAIDATRASMARHSASPRGYYALAGFGAALGVLGSGIEGPGRWAAFAAAVLIELGAIRWAVRSTGAVPRGTFRQPGAWRAWIMIAVLVAAVLVAVAADSMLLTGVAAAAVFVVWAVLGPQWDAAWLRSMEAHP